MLRVAEQYAGTDTGRQRRANEDSLLARAPLFVVADGMGGARAGEVASRMAVEIFARGIGDPVEPAAALADLVREANASIYERSHRHADQAGMGTTLTALYVGAKKISIAHVGDSRAYRMRGGALERLTEDHSLVDELIREGRLTPEEAVEHPQRSVITRALGPESSVEVDTLTVQARGDDIFLLCSDGLTTMLGEGELERLLAQQGPLRDMGEGLIGAANEAGGRDNISVVLVRVEDVRAGRAGEATPGGPGEADGSSREDDALPQTASMLLAGDAEGDAAADGSDGLAAPREGVRARTPRLGPARESASARRSHKRRVTVLVVVAVLLALIATGAYVALQSVYFIGTNNRGLVTLFRGVPFRLPLNIALYQSDYVTGVSASTLAPARRGELLDHSLRSEGNAIALLHSLELGEVGSSE